MDEFFEYKGCRVRVTVQKRNGIRIETEYFTEPVTAAAKEVFKAGKTTGWIKRMTREVAAEAAEGEALRLTRDQASEDIDSFYQTHRPAN